MTEERDDSDSDLDDIGTFVEAKRHAKEKIAELREGDKSDRRLADVLEQCCKGNRCGQDDCPVCMRRIQLMEQRIDPDVVYFWGSDRPTLQVRVIRIDAIEVTGKRRPLDEEKVRAIAASMKQFGLHTPITVHEYKKKLVLVSGLHRLEAARRLKWDAIPCFVSFGDAETRPWEIVENLYRAELSALERAEHIDELRLLIQQKAKGGQDAPPGGRQPEDAGIKKTARALGFTKEQIRRAKKIAGISEEARAEAKRLGLDDNQRALLEIAKLPTATAQLLAAKRIDERIRAAQARRATAITAVQADTTAAARITTIQADITAMMDEAQGLNDELAGKRSCLRSLQEQLVADCVDKVPITADSPAIAPADEVAPIGDRLPLSLREAGSLGALTAAWDEARELKRAWARASTRVRRRFIDKIAEQPIDVKIKESG